MGRLFRDRDILWYIISVKYSAKRFSMLQMP